MTTTTTARRRAVLTVLACLAWSGGMVHALAPHPSSSPAAARSEPGLSAASISAEAAPPPPPKRFSDAAEWHRQRRRAMIAEHGDRILALEREASSRWVGLPLLAVANGGLLAGAVVSGSLPLPAVVGLALFPGSILSLWQLQILHDGLHGCLLEKGRSRILGVPRKQLQDAILFWGSMPSVFGYYLYLRFGHLTHHTNVGDPDRASLAKLFDSDQENFEDGDVLFVAHRMELKGEIGPTFELPFDQKLTMSISKSGFDAWQPGEPIRNAGVFAASFLFERFLLVFNDAVVAVLGQNLFFPNKPATFHADCASYARCATLVRLGLLLACGWKSLLFLYLSETLWSLPPHPAAAMFVTNHPSSTDTDTEDGGCVPSRSTYAGAWYSWLTLGTNYHCEHHDFPTIPLHRLHELRKIAPEYYREGADDDVYRILEGAFDQPDFYACMDAGIGALGRVEEAATPPATTTTTKP